MDGRDAAIGTVPTLQSSTHSSLRVGNTPKNREKEAAHLRRDDDDDSSSADESSQMSHSSGSRGALRNSASSEKQESSKEWMFEGSVSMAQFDKVKDGQIPDSEIPNFISRNYQSFGEGLQLTFSQQAPVKIECIAILSDSQTVRWNRENVVVNVRGYVAAAKRATRQAWEESIEWYDEDEVRSLTWTKVTGGIRCWPQFIRDTRECYDSKSTLNVLALWGNRRYFDATGSAWMFTGKLILPPRTADCDVLQMATEVFNAAAGPPDARPDGITFLEVHCDFTGLNDIDPTKRVRFPCRGFLQGKQSKCYKWQSWLSIEADPRWLWHPLRGGLGGNREFEDAENEVKTETSGWFQLLVQGQLGKNNARKLSDAEKARAAAPPIFSPPVAVRVRIGFAHSRDSPSFRFHRPTPQLRPPAREGATSSAAAPQAPRRPRHQHPPQPRPPAQAGATASSPYAAEKDRARLPLPLLHRCRAGGGGG